MKDKCCTNWIPLVYIHVAFPQVLEGLSLAIWVFFFVEIMSAQTWEDLKYEAIESKLFQGRWT